VLNAILGDGMSSRLFLSLVDRDALAYDVSSGVVEYADAGALEISAGVDPGRVGRTLDAILRELALLRDEVVSADELAKAKAYLSGGLELRMEETRHLASWIGGQEALHERVLTLDEALAAVAAVSSADLARIAGQLFRNDALRLAVVAPARSLRGLDRHLKLAA
jgi:predicted Zn-dependent peptidase